MIEQNKNLNKREFCDIVFKTVKGSIAKKHVTNVVSIFLEELFKEIIYTNKLKIINFGSFHLKKMKPRKFFNVKEGKVTLSEGNNLLRFNMCKKIKKIIYKSLDINKTFMD